MDLQHLTLKTDMPETGSVNGKQGVLPADIPLPHHGPSSFRRSFVYGHLYYCRQDRNMHRDMKLLGKRL
jgi:hypothetical protein